MKVKIIFYSMFGHTYKMAEAVAEGVRGVQGAEVELLQVPELCPEEVLKQSGADKARQAFAHIPVAQVTDLLDADALIFGTPTRFGNVCAQMRNFIDQTGGLWAESALAGKVGSVFISCGGQHAGQETTLTSFHVELLGHGMLIVGLAPSEYPKVLDLTGGGPYGAGTITGVDGKRMPSDTELEMARAQGRRVATIAKKLAGK